MSRNALYSLMSNRDRRDLRSSSSRFDDFSERERSPDRERERRLLRSRCLPSPLLLATAAIVRVRFIIPNGKTNVACTRPVPSAPARCPTVRRRHVGAAPAVRSWRPIEMISCWGTCSETFENSRVPRRWLVAGFHTRKPIKAHSTPCCHAEHYHD